MSNRKKCVPVFGIVLSVIIGLLITVMLTGLIVSCNSNKEKDDESEVKNCTYTMSQMR